MIFEWPFLLLSLGLIPILTFIYIVAQRRRRKYAVRFTNLALLSHVVGRAPGVRRHIPPFLFLIGMAALLLSLARPVAVLALPRERSTVMLVMDISGSMTADDLLPNRMSAARNAARVFVQQLPPHVSVGLAVFNDEARLRAPIVRDHDAILAAIDSLRAAGGTAIGDGLSVAIDHLVDQPADANGQRPPALVVLLSDGESQTGLPPGEAAQRAAAASIQVNTVGIGQRGIRTQLGQNQTAGLDEATLGMIADTTGGQYFYAAEASELQDIYSNLSTQVSWIEERTEVTALAAAAGALLLIAGALFSLRWFQQLP